MLDFTYTALPARIVFGGGRIGDLPDELARLGIGRALLLTTPGRRQWAETLAESASSFIAGVFDEARMHVPVETVAKALALAERVKADGTIAIGGGSTIGLGKALALERGLPQIAVPTTYAGSEMTPIWGKTEAGRKTTGRDPAVLPKAVIYDPALTTGLPAAVSGPSGINAIAHCVEALYAPDANPVTSLMAEDAIRALAGALPRIVESPSDLEARTGALYGAWLAGLALASTTMALHHKLCHTLGGRFDLPHAGVHTVILPHAAAYNAAAAPDAMTRLGRALGADEAPRGLFALAERIGAPTSLAEIGMPEDGIREAASLAVQDPYANPAPVTEDGIEALLRRAFKGEAPSP